MSDGVKKLIRVMVVGILLSFCLTGCLFYVLFRQYQSNVETGSASHLIEINLQGQQNISAFLARDQELARDLSQDINDGVYSGENAMLAAFETKQHNWDIGDICIYTADGRCADIYGASKNTTRTAEQATETVLSGETFSVIGSQTEYSATVKTEMKFNGSEIVAISVVNDLDNLIDGIGFRPFSGQGTTYLTRQNGIQICKSGSSSPSLYNILTYFDGGSVREIGGSDLSIGSLMEQGEDGTFLFDNGEGRNDFIVLSPVKFMGETLYLVSVVPENVVNQTQNAYSRNLMLISILMVLLIVLLFAAFFIMFMRRSQRYNADVRTRERLFDLLVSKTKNAFVLLEENRREPVYVTSNAPELLGERTFYLARGLGGYYLRSDEADDSGIISALNAAMSDWDGEKEFISGYIPYHNGPAERYMRFSLYPSGDMPDTGRREFIGIFQDVTPEYQREENLREALALADSANKAKTQFLSSVSHDIRMPLNAIINMSKFLQNDIGDRQKEEEEIDVIQQSSEHLLGLVNDVLDLSRIESGRMEFLHEGFDIQKSVDTVYEMIRPLCEAKEQKLTLQKNNIIHRKVIGDAQRLNQILINILNNAMKFTPEKGEITFYVTELDTIAAEAAPFRFEVSDNGIGISEEQLPQIFDPFSRAPDGTVKKTEGSGLGLAITRNFIDALGGTISVQSEVGKGSVFTVELSYEIDGAWQGPENMEQKGDTEVSLSGKRVLVAEDNAINLAIAEKILSSWGMTVDTAENGRIAVDKFTGSETGSYDMIYLDIQMPVMNGYQAAQAIRSSEREDAHSVPIVAMTANAFAEDVEHARSSGMNAHVPKPVDPDRLHSVTCECLRENGARQ